MSGCLHLQNKAVDKMKTDVLIAGCGCAGLYCALQLPEKMRILLLAKGDVTQSDSFLAQGGICMLRDESDYEGYFEDTMRAGHYENNPASVEIMIRSSQNTIKDLLDYGVRFHREADGSLSFTREGGHSAKRILFHEDITGKEITEKLLEQAKKRKNITILEYCTMIDIVCNENSCCGAVVRDSMGKLSVIYARDTVLACGGIGGLYRHSTNYRQLTGDGVAIALSHGIAVEHINYVQIHPTTLYCEQADERSFLISESVRGEGAVLYNVKKERFVDELLPRDVLTRKIHEQMEKDKMPFVWLSMEHIPKQEIEEHFPNIVRHCQKKGFDVFHECIPVVPAQHYFMGGVQADLSGHTSMDRLYAVGETACNGVHGKNRLASNSLLESLVFAKRAAKAIAESPAKAERVIVYPDLESYQNEAALAANYKKKVLNEIARLNKECSMKSQ